MKNARTVVSGLKKALSVMIATVAKIVAIVRI